MNITADYVYTRKDGGTTHCYGKIEEDSNFEITCDNEYKDGIAADVDATVLNTWRKVCKYLEANYDSKIEELSTC